MEQTSIRRNAAAEKKRKERKNRKRGRRRLDAKVKSKEMPACEGFFKNASNTKTSELCVMAIAKRGKACATFPIGTRARSPQV